MTARAPRPIRYDPRTLQPMLLPEADAAGLVIALPTPVDITARPMLTRIAEGSSAEMVASLLAVLLPDARTVIDMTWGRGMFWRDNTSVAVTGVDIRPHGAPSLVADFRRLPFADGSFDVAVFDPPYLTDVARHGTSKMARRFGSYATLDDLQAAVQAGAREAWRVSRLGVIVKVQDYCHASRLVRMTRWVEDAIPADLYDVAYLRSTSKLEDPKWSRIGGQLSVRSNATSWLVWRRDGAVHKRRSA